MDLKYSFNKNLFIIWTQTLRVFIYVAICWNIYLYIKTQNKLHNFETLSNNYSLFFFKEITIINNNNKKSQIFCKAFIQCKFHNIA